jgi:hypothetical protein
MVTPLPCFFSASRLLPEAGLDVEWQQFYQREGLSQEKQKNKKLLTIRHSILK